MCNSLHLWHLFQMIPKRVAHPYLISEIICSDIETWVSMFLDNGRVQVDIPVSTLKRYTYLLCIVSRCTFKPLLLVHKTNVDSSWWTESKYFCPCQPKQAWKCCTSMKHWILKCEMEQKYEETLIYLRC